MEQEYLEKSLRDDKANFKESVYELVAQIPRGRVMTYGQIAVLCGKPRAARVVGGIAHYGSTHLHNDPKCFRSEFETPLGLTAKRDVESSGTRSSYHEYDSLHSSDSPWTSSACEACGGKEIPWHRVVNRLGDMASGYWGGKSVQANHLGDERVIIKKLRIANIKDYLWSPL